MASVVREESEEIEGIAVQIRTEDHDARNREKTMRMANIP